MRKLIITLSVILLSFTSKATIHVVNVWDGYYQFVDAINFSADLTIQLGDTVQWLPLDVPMMMHTITSTNIPAGAAAFDQLWQAPSDTFFQYVPQVAGLYEYECTPHAISHGMIGSITVIGNAASISGNDLNGDLLFYPNPATNFIHLNESNSPYAYRIFTLKGNLVLSGATDAVINISKLANGSYYIEIVGDKQRILKLVKQ